MFDPASANDRIAATMSAAALATCSSDSVFMSAIVAVGAVCAIGRDEEGHHICQRGAQYIQLAGGENGRTLIDNVQDGADDQCHTKSPQGLSSGEGSLQRFRVHDLVSICCCYSPGIGDFGVRCEGPV